MIARAAMRAMTARLPPEGATQVSLHDAFQTNNARSVGRNNFLPHPHACAQLCKKKGTTVHCDASCGRSPSGCDTEASAAKRCKKRTQTRDPVIIRCVRSPHHGAGNPTGRFVLSPCFFDHRRKPPDNVVSGLHRALSPSESRRTDERGLGGRPARGGLRERQRGKTSSVRPQISANTARTPSCKAGCLNSTQVEHSL